MTGSRSCARLAAFAPRFAALTLPDGCEDGRTKLRGQIFDRSCTERDRGSATSEDDFNFGDAYQFARERNRNEGSPFLQRKPAQRVSWSAETLWSRVR
jgi:hypothetical protein